MDIDFTYCESKCTLECYRHVKHHGTRKPFQLVDKWTHNGKSCNGLLPQKKESL